MYIYIYIYVKDIKVFLKKTKEKKQQYGCE